TQMAQQGKRAVLFFAVLHSGITQVRAARHIDPDYARMLTEAVQQGVEVICYAATLSAQGMVLNMPLSWAE
ncbi:MAG: DNA/RNA nuclease SfsA, partial [Plesiomonas sp.]